MGAVSTLEDIREAIEAAYARKGLNPPALEPQPLRKRTQAKPGPERYWEGPCSEADAGYVTIRSYPDAHKLQLVQHGTVALDREDVAHNDAALLALSGIWLDAASPGHGLLGDDERLACTERLDLRYEPGYQLTVRYRGPWLGRGTASLRASPLGRSVAAMAIIVQFTRDAVRLRARLPKSITSVADLLK